MPNPKRRHSKARTAIRRAHDHLKAPGLSLCPNCHEPKLPYLRTLAVLTKKVELDLRASVDALTRFWRELEEVHDYVHEIYPDGTSATETTPQRGPQR